MTTFYLITKDPWTSRFAQAADLFEPFKFFGRLVKVQGEITLPLPEVLERMQKGATERFAVVGLIVPQQGSVVLDDHTVMSDGDGWCMLDDVFEAFEAPLISP